jgi:hypothetical protein
MKNLKLALLFFMFFFVNLNGQNHFEFNGLIKDFKKNPISKVHLKIIGQDKGVVTNNDGTFLIKNNKCNFKVIASHINYRSKELQFDCKNNIFKEIILNENIINLSEVQVKTPTAISILKQVILKLNDNHKIEMVTYTLFNRIIEHQNYKPIILQEFMFDMSHDANNKCQFKIIKINQNSFNDAGRKKIEDSRLISIHINESYNLLRFKPKYLKKILKKYSYVFKGTIKKNNKNFYVLEILPNRNLEKIILHIDVESYGISYIKKIYDEERSGKVIIKNDVAETFFDLKKGKWYFDKGIKRNDKCDTKLKLCFSEENISIVLDKKNVLAISKEEEMGNMAQKLSDLDINFEDKNWKTDKYFSLPIWLKNYLYIRKH